MSAAILNEQLCFALYSASSHLTSLYRPLLDPLGLTYPQFIVLLALNEEDGVSISHLAGRTALGKATMTPLLKRLEQKQLVERHFVENNERQKKVLLTEKGKELANISEGITDKVFCATGLTKQQAEQVISVCKQLTKSS